MPIKINDHERLHDWLLRAALAGAASALVPLLFARVGPALPAPLIPALFVAMVVGVVVPPTSLTEGASLSLLAIGAAAVAPLPSRYALPALALLVGAGYARGLGDRGVRRRLGVLGVGALAALAAGVIERALLETGVLTARLGPGLGVLVAGAIAGAVTGLGAIGRLLVATGPEPLGLATLVSQVTAASPEVGALLRRAADAHRQAIEVMAEIPGPEAEAARSAADDLMERLRRYGRQWLAIEGRATDPRPELLAERVVLLQGRLARSTDPIARAELGRAITAVEGQVEALGDIARGRERAVARLEHQVATLERLRLAALRHRSADAGRLQAELAPVVEALTEAGGDYDLASDALLDAERDPA